MSDGRNKIMPKLHLSGIIDYFKKKTKISLLSGSLIFIAGIAACSIAATHFAATVPSDGLTIKAFDIILADTIFSLILALPSLALFALSYMVWEAHSLGWKLSSAVCVAAILIAVTNQQYLTNALIIAVLSGAAAILVLRTKRATEQKDSPKVTENLAKFGLLISSLLCVGVLLGMIIYLGVRASPYLSWTFFSDMHWSWPAAGPIIVGSQSGPLGGVMGYTLGSLLLVAFCELIALPLGIGAAIYLSEYASQNKITAFVRLFIEILAGVPSIVIGLVALGVLLGTLHWTNYLVTGALALSFMILPWNIRVSEEAIKSVPASYREASFALGATKWQTVRKAVLFAAIPGIITGILLGVGAAFGETAIVLLAAGDPPSGPNTLPAVVHLFGQYSGPIPCLTTFIYRAPTLLAFNAGSTRPDAVFNIYSVASAAGFILVMIYFGVCIIGLLARNYFNKKITGK